MKLKVDVGEDFPLDAEVIDAKTRQIEVKTRGRIAFMVIGIVAVALAAATVMGLHDGTYNELNCVWNAAGLFVGAVVDRYLGRKNE